MKRIIITDKSKIKRNKNYTPFVIISGQKVKVYWWTELQCSYYWEKDGNPFVATM